MDPPPDEFQEDDEFDEEEFEDDDEPAEKYLEQTIYNFNEDKNIWEFVVPPLPDQTPPVSGWPSNFVVVTWNIDFMEACAAERLTVLLSYLQRTVVSKPSSSSSDPPIILLQELHRTCFSSLVAHPMVRAFYAVTSLSPTSWGDPQAQYGLITLIPRSLIPTVVRVFRTPFANTSMAREALYVEVRIDPDKIIRIANTHLESLRGPSDQARVDQLASVSDFLHTPRVYGGVVAGDMNPIGPLDEGLPERLGLVDTWIASREELVQGADARQRRDEEKEGHTWGYQPRSKFPPRRMDKVLLAGNMEVESMERIGVGLKLSIPTGRNGESETLWATDHYGLVARINVI